MAGRQAIAAQARLLAKRLRALEEGNVRTRAAARALSKMEPACAAEVIAELIRMRADPFGTAAVAAMGRALWDPGAGLRYELLTQMYEAAIDLGLDEVSSLLLSPGPCRVFVEPFDKSDPRVAQLTLGEKKAMARLHRDPDRLARLAAEGEPAVVRELLRNPRLTEELAVRIAARRPCRPETLRCLYEDRRWRTRPAVALALARNPYLETSIGLKILPTLGKRELVEIGQDGNLHPLMRAMAARLGR